MDKDIELIRSWLNSPIKFIRDIWGLEPQPLICQEAHSHVFKCFGPFVEGKMMTWQQYLILEGVERALRSEAPKRLSIASGHGIGKGTTLAWLIHWFLFTRENSQIGCTAPTSSQMYDVLWKELAVWHYKLPTGIKELFEWSTTHYKIKEKPETWWARARTASKETPEAFAGLHAKDILLIADEASGVPDEIFRTGEGSLTGENTLVILTSNPTRLEGYFYDSHHNDSKNWQTFAFDVRESPIVKPDYVERIRAKYGEDSDEYGFMVLGKFPREDGLRDGWMPLLNLDNLKYVEDVGAFNNPKLGVDPAGLGSNKTLLVLRDSFKAKVVSTEEKSDTKSIASRVMTIMIHYKVKANQVVVDNFGIGANLSQEIALADHSKIRGINVGDFPDDRDRYLNIKAEVYWRLREWLIVGGRLVKHPDWKQLLTIKYKRTGAGKIQIMSKEEMIKKGWESPDLADALALTFFGDNFTVRRQGVEELSGKQIAELTSVYK